MASPLISVIVPTIGRATLEDTLASIPRKDTEIIVVADGREAYEKAKQIVGRKRVRLEFNEERSNLNGHPQRTVGMGLATGEWLAFMDDDDIYTKEAFKAFRRAALVDGPHIFRMRYEATGEVLWAGQRLIRGNVGTPMFFCQNGRVGQWKEQPTGDFDFIESTCIKQGKPTWHDDIVCVVRPKGN